MSDSLRSDLRARDDLEGFTLASRMPDATPFVSGKSTAKDELGEMGERLFDLHELLFANKSQSLLLVLQGTDASGKNGTIKHVVRRVNPAGVTVTGFTEPTEEELEHHFLWRIRKAVPEPGTLGVFNRSHYEDILVPMAERTLSPDEIDERVSEIVEFEQQLSDEGIIVVKCLLHISYDEQRERFLRRLRRHDKRWKFAEADLETRKLWDEYAAAYGDVVAKTSTPHAPWYIVPSDHKWYRNWAIARILIETLEELGLDYPEPDLDLDALRQALEPPR